MKRSFFHIILIFISTLILSCSADPDDAGKTQNTQVRLMSNVADTTPSIEPAATKKDIPQRAGENEWGGAYYKTNLQMIYRVFQEYDPVTGNGTIDSVNIYMVLYSTEQLLNMILNSDGMTTLDADTAFSPTFDFGTDDEMYDQTAYQESSNESMGTNYYNSLAYKTDGDIVKGLFGSRMESEETESYSCTQFTFDSATGDVNLNFAMFNDYIGGTMAGSYYYVRSYITGNMNTHEFFVQVQVAAGDFGDINIIGRGISQGGDGDYYVVYIDNDYEPESAGSKTPGYYLLPASADEDYYRTLDASSPTAETDYNNLTSADDTALSYGEAIQDYLDAGNMFDGNIVEADFANGGILNILK